MSNSGLHFYTDYLFLSPYTYTVQTALLEKQLPFETIPVAFQNGKTSHEKFNSLSPTGLIPLLVHGDFVLNESLAILEYLEEAFPERPIFPKNIKHRAQARVLLSHYRCAMRAIRDERSTETIFYENQRKGKPLSQQAQEEAKELSDILLSTLKPGQTYLFNSEWSIADTETALMLHRMMMNGDSLDPLLVEYAQTQWKRPSVQKFVGVKRPPFISYY